MVELLKEAGFQGATVSRLTATCRVCNVGRRSEAHCRHVLHVRRQAVRPVRMEALHPRSRRFDRPQFAKCSSVVAPSIKKGGGDVAGGAARAPGRRPQAAVNIVLVAEGEEEIGSPHFGQVVHHPDVLKALSKCHEVFSRSPRNRPRAAWDSLGAKGMIEVGWSCSTEKCGRGSKDDIHSSNRLSSTVRSAVGEGALDIGVGRRQRSPIDG